MKMVTHEAIGVDLPFGFGTGFAERFEEQFAVLVAEKNVLAMVAAVHDVVNGAFVLDTQFSGHDGIIANLRKLVNTKDRPLFRPILRTDPFFDPFLTRSDRCFNMVVDLLA